MAAERQKLITVESLEKSLGSKMETLKAAAVNPGANFLSGKGTSPFQKAVENEASGLIDSISEAGAELTASTLGSIQNKAHDMASSLTSSITSKALAQGTVGGEALELAGNIGAAVQLGKAIEGMVDSGAIQDLIMGLTKTTVDTITSRTTQMITGAVTTITAKTVSIPVDITKAAMTYFNTYKMSLSQMLKELEKEAEEKVAAETTESEKKTQSIFNDKVKGNIKKLQDGMSALNDGLSAGISMISSYLENGPEWIANKLDKEVQEKLSYAETFVNKGVKAVTDEIDQFTSNQGEAVGKNLTEEYNAFLQQKAKVQLAKIMELKAKAIAKAKALMQEAILLLMGLLGINIPV